MFRVTGLVTLAIVAMLTLTVSNASALETRQLQTQITGTCPAPGNCPAAQRIGFSEPEGLTVDSSGRLWVVDGRQVGDRFSAVGAFEAQNTGTGSWEEGKIRRLAFSQAAGEVFVADSTHCALWGLEAASAAASGKQLRPFGATEPCSLWVAADNSAGGTGGDLYVLDGTKVLRIKASTGAADDFTAGSGIGTNELAAPFTSAFQLAVAPDGTLYVGGFNAGGETVVYQFEPSGEFTGLEFTEAEGQPIELVQAMAVAPSSEDLIIADNNQRVYEFEPSGGFLLEITKPGGAEFHAVDGLAVDSTGRLYAAEASGEKLIDVFGPLITLPDVTTGAAEVHSTTAVTLHGEVNPAGKPVTGCFFEYGPTTAYGQTAGCEPAAAALGEGNVPVPVEAQLSNLTPGTVYHYRLVAAGAEGTNSGSEDREFITGPTIDATSASEVTATSARLETEVNPQGLATSYSFQYGPTTAYGTETPMPPAPLGAGTVDVTRSAFISGLEPGTTYHYRVLATNALGTVEGPDRTFTTQPAAGSSLLPDGRGWELVSPALKQGVPLGPINREGGVIQAAADGSAITYWAKGSILPEAAGNVSVFNSQELSTRAASGWATQDITTPHQTPIGATAGRLSEYRLFSSDLSLGAVGPYGETRLSPAAKEETTPYLRLPDGAYEPLLDEANVPPGTRFADARIVTATPDLSHVLLKSAATLVSGFEAEGFANIYEWSDGVLTPVSFVPPGTTVRCSGPACLPGGGSTVGNGDSGVRNAVSTDGSRVVFNFNGRLYLRDTDSEETLLLDAPQGGSGNAGGAKFQYASADGSRVFFTDDRKLTAGSTAAEGKPDLYMCQVEIEADHLACDLTDLSANTLHPAEPAAVQGAVIGGAADGSTVYFVANGALTAGDGAVSGDCTIEPQPTSNQCNLYRYDAHTDELALVAVLSGADQPDWSAGGGGALTSLTARVSPNGRFLAFMSERPLTGYDNRDARSGVRDQEVFIYDSTTGRLACASCNPSGARPQGVFDPGFPSLLVDAPRLWQGHTLAASIPGWTGFALLEALYQSRYLSDSGRLFFNAADALVPQDTNGTEDVYQWEPPSRATEPPPGDTCTADTSTYSPSSGGCVDLISSGTSGEESAFMDADETGENVFFLTASRLTARDEDTALDLYDARVGGGEVAPVKPVECSGDACQQPAVPPNHPTPGTSLVNGPENAKECPKGKQLKKGKCVKKQSKKKKHHKKKGNKKHKRAAGHNRGGHK